MLKLASGLLAAVFLASCATPLDGGGLISRTTGKHSGHIEIINPGGSRERIDISR